MRVEHWNTDQDGPLSEAGLAKKLEQLGYSVYRYLYPPGTVFSAHKHSVDKLDAVFSGQFRISMGNDSVILKAGDFVYVPAGMLHSAEVVGHATVVSFDAIRR